MQVLKKKSEVPLVDLMEGCERWEIDVDGQFGRVALVDIMPRLVPAGVPCSLGDPGVVECVDEEGFYNSQYYQPRKFTADMAIVQAARTSTGQGFKGESEDRNLVRYLMRMRHTTPVEMVTCKFYHVLPIFVARQLVRHRTVSLNEYSLRYSEAKDQFWLPEAGSLRKQGVTNKQGGDEPMTAEEVEDFLASLSMVDNEAMEAYQKAIKGGMARELARVILPVNLYTTWYWQISLHNLIHFLGLRQDKHAQKEIRDYADAMYTLIRPLVPVAIEAYDDYHPNRGGMQLSRLDIACLSCTKDFAAQKYLIDQTFGNNRELTEFKAKMERLGHVNEAFMADKILKDRSETKAK